MAKKKNVKKVRKKSVNEKKSKKKKKSVNEKKSGSSKKHRKARKTSNGKKRKKLFKGLKLNLQTKKALLIWLGVLVLLIFGALIFFFRDEVFMALPGFYDNRARQNLTEKKNELISENSDLLEDNNKINSEISELSNNLEDTKKKFEKNKQILKNLETLRGNCEKVLEYDDEILAMRLPYNLSKYSQMSKAANEIRLELIETYIDFINARIEMNLLNIKRSQFDKCLSEVPWESDDDARIADSIEACLKKITEIKQHIGTMEEDYDTELPELNNYFTLLDQQWKASIAYYRALDEGNYNKANEHDDVFAEKKRALSEIDVEIFNEFDEKVTDVYALQINQLLDEEKLKEQEADEWFDDNLR
jgi:hypothetical protein